MPRHFLGLLFLFLFIYLFFGGGGLGVNDWKIGILLNQVDEHGFIYI